MTTLLIGLEAPLQSWGDSSRFTERKTRPEPTKSGVLGLLAAALGRRRTDPIEDLVALTFGVRTDQAGELTRDFQTAIDWRTGKSKPLSHRYYLADAKFVAGIEGSETLIAGIAEALIRPTFPLYLGRRSCPPAGPMTTSITSTPLSQALREAEWTASARHRAKQARSVTLPIVRDAVAGDEVSETIRDTPVSFDPTDRQYTWRNVVYDVVHMPNPDSTSKGYDWLAALGGN
ncbi:type I-E CRISPR-associated protein Cas5/CasD [Gordonia sp. TBRC 11910]|uniref:Type I-E CRISPR-associated protein Cas5/CasD n=1 Tax=Gordonia asplenii TaxID=2725283 RepID=A0A848L850_9ACTN|nr:type I-E CRISPR-associated protein Cas5/CasD [Gordonia asplenii]NMO04933.1 type I-E CRISPR-associated protein Cas5/CasD [Gordonia asplenii]